VASGRLVTRAGKFCNARLLREDSHKSLVGAMQFIELDVIDDRD